MALKEYKRATCPFKSLSDGGLSDLWTVSASGTNEYYYTGTDVLIKPLNVQENGSDLTAGTVGSLAIGEWAWADNDSIGANRPYVRLNSATPDPDGNPADFVKCSEPLVIFTAPATPTRTIQIGLEVTNNQDTTVDADVVIYTDSGVGTIATFVKEFTIKGTDSPANDGGKKVYAYDERLMILTDKELVSVWLTTNES